jgi:hypothetical protein
MQPFRTTVQQCEYTSWTYAQSINRSNSLSKSHPILLTYLPCIPFMSSFHLFPVCQVPVFQNVPPYMPSFFPHHSITITFDLYKALVPPYSFISIQRCHVKISTNIFSNPLSYLYSSITLSIRLPLPKKTSKNMGPLLANLIHCIHKSRLLAYVTQNRSVIF